MGWWRWVETVAVLTVVHLVSTAVWRRALRRVVREHWQAPRGKEHKLLRPEEDGNLLTLEFVREHERFRAVRAAWRLPEAEEED